MNKHHEHHKHKKNPLHGTGTMTTQEIVQKSIERSDPGTDWQQVYSYLYHGIQSNKFRMLRNKDSLLFFKVGVPVCSHTHIFTAVSQEDLLKSIRKFIEVLKISGYKKIMASIKNPAILRIIRKAKSPHVVIKETPSSAGYNLEMDIK
jgi:hypothetical protein